LEHVHGVRRAEALREDVADSAQLEHRTNAAARDDTGSLACRPEQHPCSPVPSEDLVRDRRSVFGDGEEVLLRILDRLRDRQRHLAGLAVADADAVDLLAADAARSEREAPAALDNLRDPVDLDHALLELAGLGVFRHQKCRPPLRAASASAFPRPWYRWAPRANTGVFTPAAFAFCASSFPASAACSVFAPLASRMSSQLDAANVFPASSSTSCAPMPRLERKTTRRGRSAVPDTCLRTRLWRRARDCRVVNWLMLASRPSCGHTRPGSGSPCLCTAPAAAPRAPRQPSGRP